MCHKLLRAISSAGERLVYTERVGGSNPSSPTTNLFLTNEVSLEKVVSAEALAKEDFLYSRSLSILNERSEFRKGSVRRSLGEGGLLATSAM